MHSLSSISKQGFAIIHNVFEKDEVASFLDLLGQHNPERGRAGIRHMLKFQEVGRVASDVRMLRLASEVLGDGASPFRATLFHKSAVANWLIVWHQDTALPVRYRLDRPGWGSWSVKEGVTYGHAPANVLSGIVALRLSLDDSLASNGPLKVLPSSHNLGVLTDDEISDLSHRIPLVQCETTCGGVIAMRPLIVHSSSKSHAEAPRRVLHIEYASEKMFKDGLELALA